MITALTVKSEPIVVRTENVEWLKTLVEFPGDLEIGETAQVHTDLDVEQPLADLSLWLGALELGVVRREDMPDDLRDTILILARRLQ